MVGVPRFELGASWSQNSSPSVISSGRTSIRYFRVSELMRDKWLSCPFIQAVARSLSANLSAVLSSAVDEASWTGWQRSHQALLGKDRPSHIRPVRISRL